MQDYQWSTTTGRIHQKLEDDAVLLILLYDQNGNFIKLNMQIGALNWFLWERNLADICSSLLKANLRWSVYILAEFL